MDITLKFCPVPKTSQKVFQDAYYCGVGLNALLCNTFVSFCTILIDTIKIRNLYILYVTLNILGL